MNHGKADINGLVMVFNMIRGSLDYFARKYDLSLTEMGMVFDIFSKGALTVTELSALQGIPKSTVSRLVDDLVKRGILNRERPEDNRRIVHITITPDFRAEMDRLKDDAGFQQVIEQDLPPEKGQLAIGKLRELLDILKDEHKPDES